MNDREVHERGDAAGRSIEERLERLDLGGAVGPNSHLSEMLRVRIARHRTARRRAASTAMASFILIGGVAATIFAVPNSQSRLPVLPSRAPSSAADSASLDPVVVVPPSGSVLATADASTPPSPLESPVTLQLQLVRHRMAALAASIPPLEPRTLLNPSKSAEESSS